MIKKLIFKGSGFGHRLGMSQWGAKSLADKGKKYQQIFISLIIMM